MKTRNVKFIMFSLGMGAAMASSLISIYILLLSITGKMSLLYESNPLLAVGEILLLIFSVATCIVATEVFQKYQRMNSLHKENVENLRSN